MPFSAAMSHNVNLDLNDDNALRHLNGGFGTYRHTMSKSLHRTYLSGSAASGEPMAFAASSDYPPMPPQESYNMADLSVCGDASGSTSAQDLTRLRWVLRGWAWGRQRCSLVVPPYTELSAQSWPEAR